MNRTVREVTPEAPIYLTRYALTKGIIKHTSGKVVTYKRMLHFAPDVRYPSLSKLGTEAWETEEEAVQDVRSRALKKIKSLQRQILKLQKIAAEPVWSEDSG